MNSSMEKLDSAIKTFCTVAVRIRNSDSPVQSGILQEAVACINVINSFLSMPSRLDEVQSVSTSFLCKFQQSDQLLKCIPPLLLKLISDTTHVESKDKEYWYGNLLQSIYLCFRSLRVQGLIQINLDYFFELLNYTSDSLKMLQRKCNNQIILLLLLRIVYACLAGLPIKKLPVSDIANVLVAYFDHDIATVRLSARNAAQFLIPVVEASQRHCFLLTAVDVAALLNSSGKDMPASSLLKLLYMYGQIPKNNEIFLQEGIFYYAFSVMFQSPRAMEKRLAFSVILMLSSHQKAGKVVQDDTSQENTTIQDAINPNGDSVISVAKKSLTDILAKLSEQAQSYITALNQEGGKATFNSFKALLEDLEKDHIISSNTQLHEAAISERISKVLQNITIVLLEDLTIIKENQALRYINLMTFECWEALKKLGNIIEKPLCASSIFTLIDKDLLAISSYIQQNKTTNEVTVKSLKLCFEILEDLLYGSIVFNIDLPLPDIQKHLIDLEILRNHGHPFRLKVQILLCTLVSDADGDVLADLCVTDKFITNLIQQLGSCEDLKRLVVALKKVKALTKISGNRVAFRKFKILPALQKLSEKHTGSAVEHITSDLICILLSDPQDDVEEEDNPLVTFEAFMAACFEDNVVPESYKSGIEELISSSATDLSNHDIPSVVVNHATHLYQVMLMGHDEFHGVLYSSKLTNVPYLVSAAKLLNKLSTIYEDCNQTNEVAIKCFEKQIVTISQKYLPEFICVSFKAMKDGYSDLLSDLDREVFFNSFLPYLSHLHFVIEHWSKMNFDVKTVLVNYGAFHLLLNELHTAPTAEIITSNIIYSTFSALYNVLLDPELARRFRITIIQRLFNYFLNKDDMGIRCLTKFSISCMHTILSRSEFNKVCLISVEADMLARCLNGVDSFFSGHDNLIVTIANLGRNPRNCQVFVDAGIIGILKSLAVTSTSESTTNGVLCALLNMIPEPEISSQTDNISLPLCNSVTETLTADATFMQLLHNSNKEVSKVLCLLLKPMGLEKPDFDSIQLLYKLKRYTDCSAFCNKYISSLKSQDCDNCDRVMVELYKAKSMFYDYNRELMERFEQSKRMPGFEYKTMMRSFCNSRILEVVNVLAKVKRNYHEKFFDDEAAYMLDKALLDFVVFGTKEITTCLLCHCYAQKLIHSHYIPKAILQEFVKAMELDPGADVFMFSPTGHPSDWRYKSAKQITFSMLCKTCDGTYLSRDEHLFKSKFFSKLYQKDCPGSHLQAQSIPYAKYLYRFAIGLMFRNIAPLYSSVSAEIGEFSQLHFLMQACRDIIINESPGQWLPTIYMVILPSEIPDELPKVAGWHNYVLMTNSPYAAYKLLQPGEPMVPKRLFCFMVKIGIMIFVISLDRQFDKDFEATCPKYKIQFDCDGAEIFVPEDKERSNFIPQKLWWSLLGWARLEINNSLSYTLSNQRPPKLANVSQAGLMVKDILESKEPRVSPVTANLLPPGVELNYERYGTLPEKVIIVPDGHAVLLHYAFSSSTGSHGYAALCRQIPGKLMSTEPESKEAKAYKIFKQPYVLIYLQDEKKRLHIKIGFSLHENELKIKDTFPGVPAAMKESVELKEFVEQIPDKLCAILRAKGFRSLKSLLYWQELLTLFNNNEDTKINLCLDIRCINDRCIYCDMRCDICLQPCLDRFKIVTFPTLGEVHCCSEQCSNYLFTEDSKREQSFALHKVANEIASQTGHAIILWGYFTVEDTDYPRLNTTVQYTVRQASEDITGLYSIPCGTQYVTLWSRSIYKPFCIEYTIDDDFNAIELLNSTDSGKIFSRAEEKEMMNQLHEMLVKSGIPYHFATLKLQRS